MSDTKFTPGPWRKQERGNLGNAIEAHCGKWQYGEYYSVVATYQDALPYGNDASFHDERENMEANGHLIAAAPELYEALIDLKTLEESELVGVEFKRAMRQAISNANSALAKARGEV